MSKYSFMILMLVIGSIAATVWLLIYDGASITIAWFWQSINWVQANQLKAAMVFFLVSVVSQMIVMPSGSLMLLVAGFALGGLTAAGIFALAQVLTAWPVYRLSNHVLAGLEARLLKGAKARRVESVRQRIALLKGNDLLATALLRLTPVIPSAGACLLASIWGIRLKMFLIGTLLTCWIRPLFFAGSGEALSEAVLRTNGGGVPDGLNLWPLLLIFFSTLVLFLANFLIRVRLVVADRHGGRK